MEPLKPDYQSRLSEYISGERFKVREPSTINCAAFTAGAVEAMTGHNPISQWIKEDAAASMAAMKVDGYRSMKQFLDAHYEKIGYQFAQVGDVALIDRKAMGVVVGAFIAAIGEDGRLVNVMLGDNTEVYRL